MSKTNVKVIIEKGTDNMYSAVMDCYDLGFGLSGFGKTAKEAIDDFYLCWEEEKQFQLKEGNTPPELEFEIMPDVSAFLNMFSDTLSKSGLQKITGINQKQLWHYQSGTRKPTMQTKRRIQTGLHSFAKTMEKVHFY